MPVILGLMLHAHVRQFVALHCNVVELFPVPEGLTIIWNSLPIWCLASVAGRSSCLGQQPSFAG